MARPFIKPAILLMGENTLKSRLGYIRSLVRVSTNIVVGTNNKNRSIAASRADPGWPLDDPEVMRARHRRRSSALIRANYTQQLGGCQRSFGQWAAAAAHTPVKFTERPRISKHPRRTCNCCLSPHPPLLLLRPHSTFIFFLRLFLPHSPLKGAVFSNGINWCVRKICAGALFHDIFFSKKSFIDNEEKKNFSVLFSNNSLGWIVF